mmetsp:Transcript_114882/g.199027  ORF Transcript_114882/g.199027 Transcript_114882/m.199027 type:complete len:964 (+) Transcript_114882:72-2963(+)
MAVNPAQMAQLAQLLAQTVGAHDTQTMQNAMNQLRSADSQPGFGLMLLELLRDGSINITARQAGAIYFKNYVKRMWTVEGAAGIQPGDRQAIKQHLLGLMLQAPKPIQVQLAAGLEEISLYDYPAEWQSLLPEIVNHLNTSSDINVLKGTMQTAHTVFLKFRSMARSNDALREIKYTVLGIQETHLKVFTATCERVLSNQLPPDQLALYFDLLIATMGVFYSLNAMDLPEFFEDHKEQYFQAFLSLLKFNHAAVAGSGDRQGPLEEVKGELCQCFALYTEKYQEEFSPFLLATVQGVWGLLQELSQEEKNDQLVARGIHFLSSAAQTHWPQSPFSDPAVLSGICEKVVFPNILLRDSDMELFEDNPLEYVRRDMEAADLESRRRSSMDLVKAMRRLNEAKVTEILIGYVKQLLDQAGKVPANQAERFKDACIYLCIAMAVSGETMREGVTIVNSNVNILDFFANIVVPGLQAQPLTQHTVLRASCLKFVTVFRNQLPREQIGAILPAVCGHIQAQSPVVHTYAAICIEKLLTVRDRNATGASALRYDPASMKPHLLQMVEPILRIVASQQGIPQNEYLMRGLARIFAFLKEQGAEAGLGTLKPLSAILMAMAENPANPVFNHNLFEAIAAIVKVTVSARPDDVEAALLPTMGTILEKNVTDFLPYTFQILGLLLDATSSVKPIYQALFARLLTVELWQAMANIPGLIRLIRAYFTKHAVFGELLKANMENLLGRFQLVLNNRRTESSAIDLLNAMYLHLPADFYQQYFKTLVTLLLTRLQNSKSPKFQKDFVISCSLFVHRNANPGTFPSVLSEIQAGLLMGLLAQKWLPAMKMSLRLDERKVCTLALVKLMMCDELRSNPEALAGCCDSLVALLSLNPSTKTKGAFAEEEEDELPDGGAGLEYEVSFNKLRNTDLPNAAAGLAPDVPDLNTAAKTALAPQRQAVIQLAQGNPALQPLAMFLQ